MPWGPGQDRTGRRPTAPVPAPMTGPTVGRCAQGGRGAPTNRGKLQIPRWRCLETRTFGEHPGTWKRTVLGSTDPVSRYVLGAAELILPSAAPLGNQAPPRWPRVHTSSLVLARIVSALDIFATGSASTPTPSGPGCVSRIASGSVGSGAEPDEDVSHTDRGLVADRQLVEAGRHRPELLAAVHQPLELVALAVALALKGRRPATPSTLAGPVGLLVIPLGDGVADPASPQGGPVGPAAVSLVPGQLGHPGARPPPPTWAGHPHLIHQPDQLAGVGVLARGQAGGQLAAPALADCAELGGQSAP
jgi:hypothetical protein